MNQQVFIKQTKKRSLNSKSKKRQAKIIGDICLPKEFLLLFHNQSSEKLIIKHQSLVNTEDCDHPNNLVTAINLSNFSIYFSFLPEIEQIDAYTKLISLIAKTGREAVSQFSGGLIPQKVKQVYLETISFFKTLSSGSFVTQLFVNKLCKLVGTIWRHGQNYLAFCKTHMMSVSKEVCATGLATEFIC